MPLAPGETLERRYKIDKKLGEGGFGAVYRAYDTRLDVLCAVKESFESSEEAARQFKRGASMLANLRHPHLPRVTDFFDIPNKGLYLVMDFVQGEDLLTQIQRLRQPLPEEQVVVWLKQICEALSYIHSQNPPVIHRDIKPQNIIIDQSGNAILVDFGLAKLFDAGQRTSLGARGLTPGFAPVEQYGSGATDARSDIYSLGATAYVMLTAQVPSESIQRVVNAEPLTSPRGLIRSISEPLSNAIMQALEIDPRRRPQSAKEFLGKLFVEELERKAARQFSSDSVVDFVVEHVIDQYGKPVVITRSELAACGKYMPMYDGRNDAQSKQPLSFLNVDKIIEFMRKDSRRGIRITVSVEKELERKAAGQFSSEPVVDFVVEHVIDQYGKEVKMTRSELATCGKYMPTYDGHNAAVCKQPVSAQNVDKVIEFMRKYTLRGIRVYVSIEKERARKAPW